MLEQWLLGRTTRKGAVAAGEGLVALLPATLLAQLTGIGLTLEWPNLCANIPIFCASLGLTRMATNTGKRLFPRALGWL